MLIEVLVSPALAMGRTLIHAHRGKS